MSNKHSEKMHQLHIKIPIQLHDELKNILPEWGGVTALIRNFLRNYVSAMNDTTTFSNSPFDSAVGNAVAKTTKKLIVLNDATNYKDGIDRGN